MLLFISSELICRPSVPHICQWLCVFNL